MRDYAGPGGVSLSQGTQWNIGDYVDPAILARAKLLLITLRQNGQNYLCPVYLPSSAVVEFDLERHNNMMVVTQPPSAYLSDHVYHLFFQYNPSTYKLTAKHCFEYDVSINVSNGYKITGINTSAWDSIIFTFPHIYVFYQ